MDFRESARNDVDGFDNYDNYLPSSGVRRRKEKEITLSIDNAILRSLAPEAKAIIASAMRTVNVSKEEFLHEEGDRIDYIYFPVTAVLSEFKMLEDGRMVEIAVTGSEGAIGLSTLLAGGDTAANYTQVSQAGTVKRIDAITFARMIRSNDKLRMGLNGFLDQYIRQISQKAICNMYHSVKERLCTWLLMLQDRCGKSTLKLTHEQIARTLGVYRPSVTCIAKELREQKLIDYSRGGISITDRDRVRKSACTCYSELSLA